MRNNNTPILGFAAFSGVGKTTLLTRLIPILIGTGLKIGVIKYSHHDVEVDHPGKDSFRLRKAGATPVMLVSPYRRVLITEFPRPSDIILDDQTLFFPDGELDLILVEGFRDQPFPKIELHRPSLGKPLLFPNDASIIALACDNPLTTPAYLPCLNLNAPDLIADFIIHGFLGQT